MEIKIKNKIYINNPDKVMLDLMKKSLTLPNPVFQTMLRRVKFGNQSARCLYAIKKEFRYYEYDKTMDIFVCGRGLERRIAKFCDTNSVQNIKTVDLVSVPLSCTPKFKGILRNYQQNIVEKILTAGKNGVLRLDTGWGKTILSGLLAQKLGVTTLIIAPRNIIIDQFINTFKNLFNIDCGVIQGDKFHINEITIASINTLIKRDISAIKRYFSMIIVDECHTIVTDKRIEVLQQFNPEYLYGLTGTCDRDDGQGEAIKFTFGEILVDEKLPCAKPTVYKINTGSKVVPNICYADMIEELINDETRNKKIADIIKKEVTEGRKVLCLTKRIAHNKRLEEMLADGIKCFSLDSTVKDKEAIFDEFRKGKDFDVILGTFSLLATGVNLEILSTLVIAGDLRSQTITTQSAGRCLRTMLNKPNVKIYDLVDEQNGILLSQWRSRRRVYLDKEWEII